jgi:Zn-dependent peptidase ImmA (M78 family)
VDVQGRDKARQVIAAHGTNSPEAIARAEGLSIVERHPWPARFQDIFVSPVIFVPRAASASQRRVLVAHCLGHHFLHEGNQVWLRGFDSVWTRKLERQAEEFAAFLLIPEREEPWLSGVGPGETAARYGVTEELVTLRQRLGDGRRSS